jgi:hypothetical protein
MNKGNKKSIEGNVYSKKTLSEVSHVLGRIPMLYD